MKYAEFHIENQIVEVFNAATGVESVHMNGEEISKGYSFFGRDHFFQIGNDNYIIRPTISFKNNTGMSILLYKNGLPLTLENKFSKTLRSKNRIATIIVGLVVGLVGGFIFGYTLTKFIQWLGTVV